MSAGDKVTYVYEPFFGVSINGTDIKDLIERNDLAASNLIRQNLTDLFDCRTFYVKRRGQHKNVRNCKKSLARVIKTIRVRYHQLESWIRQSDIKVKIITVRVNDLNLNIRCSWSISWEILELWSDLVWLVMFLIKENQKRFALRWRRTWS